MVRVLHQPECGSVNSSVCSSVVCTLCTLQYKATPLMCAAVEGHTDVVQILLSQQDVDINMKDEVCPSQCRGGWKRNNYVMRIRSQLP